MTRYAIIDDNSGLVWGVTDADCPTNACAQIDHDVDIGQAALRSYYEYPATYRTKENHYHVYEVPENFNVENGQTVDEIQTVRTHTKAAIVIWETKNG